MINMMYLVFIAMLALQISKEVLATLGILSEDMEKSTAELKASIDSAYNIIDQNSNQDYYKIPSEELPKLKGWIFRKTNKKSKASSKYDKHDVSRVYSNARTSNQ